MAQRRGSTAAAWLGATASLLAIGCKNPTQITLTISSNDCGSPTETSIYVGSPGSVGGNAPVAKTDACNGGYVGSLVIVPSGADDEMVGILVVMATEQSADAGGGLGTCTPTDDGSSCIEARRALPYLPHQNVQLSVYLDSRCAGVPCGASTTCVEGLCVDDTIADPASCTGEDGGCGEQALTGDAGPAVTDAGTDTATGPSDTSVADSAPADATVHDASDSSATMADGGCTIADNCYVVPAGWTLAGLDLTGAAQCPSGLSSGSPVVSNPDGGMCTYTGCSIVETPGCTSPLTFAYGAIGCGVGMAQIGATGCAAVGDPLGLPLGSVSFTTAVSLACSTPRATAPTYVPSTQLCTAPSAACGDGWCTQVFGSIDPCILTNGDAPCGDSFPVKYTIGDDATPACPTPTCTTSGECGGYVSTFTDPDCKEAGPIVAADGQCHGFGSTVGSAEYSPIGPTGAACTDPPPAAPSSLTVTNQRTACCLR